MSKVIAVVRLAQGHVAFYDEKTGMHLTMGNPMKDVFDYMDTTRIKRAVQNKVLNLVHGSLSDQVEESVKEVHIEVKPKEVKASAPTEEIVKVETPVEPIVQIEEEAPIIPVDQEDTTVIEEDSTEVVEESTDEVVEGLKTKTKRKKKED
jgi:hypothetical protein